MLWAWLIFPHPGVGTLWLLDRLSHRVPAAGPPHDLGRHSPESTRSLESAQIAQGVVELPAAHRDHACCFTPGLVAAWLLLFIASVRETWARPSLLMG